MAAALLWDLPGMKEGPMSTMVRVWGRVHTVVVSESLLPWVLGANLILLAGLEWHQGVPVWLKTAAALFLVF